MDEGKILKYLRDWSQVNAVSLCIVLNQNDKINWFFLVFISTLGASHIYFCMKLWLGNDFFKTHWHKKAMWLLKQYEVPKSTVKPVS